MILLKRTFPIVFTIAAGFLVLITFLPLGQTLAGVRGWLIDWAMWLAAAALVLGYINLIRVHWRRILQRQGSIHSIFLVVSSLIVLVLWVLFRLDKGSPAPSFLDSIFALVILPGQSALGALLAVLLAVAGFRALRVRRSVGMFLFIVAAILVVITQSAVPATVGVLATVRTQIIDPITTGGLRGLLLGVALGSVIVGLRLIFGADKPQSD